VSSDGELVLCIEQGNQLRKGETVFGNDGHQWRFTGMDKRQGTWGVFVVPQQRNDHAIRIKPQPKAKPSVNRLHGGYRTEAFKLLAQSLSLHADDAADLSRRGLTAEQIQLMGAKTLKKGHRFKAGLPGFSSGTFHGATGYWVPTLNWDGEITGGQVRPRFEDGYRWLSGCHLENGELPLQVLRGDPSKHVYLIEGTGAKPWIVHLLTGATVIGAAGGNFAASPSQVRELQKLTAGQQWVLLPDGGSIYNQHVLAQYRAIDELVPNLQVRWWGQFFKGGDADETNDWVNGSDIPSTDFWAGLSRLQAEGQTFYFDREPNLKLSQRYLDRDLLVNNQSPLDVVISGLGTGKTEALKAVVQATDGPVLVVSRNRKTVRQICNRVDVPYLEQGRSDFTDDQTANLAFMRKVGFGCCSASLRPSSALKFQATDYSGATVVLDEWDATATDAVMNQTTDIARHRAEVMAQLSELLRVSGRVIALSGTMRQMDVSLLEAITGQRAFVIRNDFQPAAGRRLTVFTKEKLLRSQLFAHLQGGKTALVHTSDQEKSNWAARNLASSAKAMAGLTDSNAEFFDGASTSSGTPRQKRLPADPDAVLKELKASFVSPVMAAGVSITLENHFDQVTVYSGGHLSVADVVQTGARLRTDAPRLLYAPSTSGSIHFGGETDWKQIRQSAHQDCRRLDDLLQLSRLEGTALDEDPWFIYGCQVYALQNLQARHYRELIARAYELQGYRVETIDRPPTTAEAKRCTTQTAHTDASNLKEAGLIADAEISDTEDLSQAGQAKGLHKKRICKVFDIDPDAVTANHVLDEKRAFATLRNRYLLNDEMALGLCTHGHLEQLGDAFVLDKARIAQLHLKLHWIKQLTTQACAADLLTKKDWFSANDDWVKRLHRLVMEDSCAKRYLGSRHSNFNCPIGVVQAILRIFGLRTAIKRQCVDGEIVRFHRITDPLHHFNPESLLKRWESRPQLNFRRPGSC